MLLKTSTLNLEEAERFFNIKTQEISEITNHSIGINMYSTNMIEDITRGFIYNDDGVFDEKFNYYYQTKNNQMTFKLIDVLKKIHKEVIL